MAEMNTLLNNRARSTTKGISATCSFAVYLTKSLFKFLIFKVVKHNQALYSGGGVRLYQIFTPVVAGWLSEFALSRVA